MLLLHKLEMFWKTDFISLTIHLKKNSNLSFLVPFKNLSKNVYFFRIFRKKMIYSVVLRRTDSRLRYVYVSLINSKEHPQLKFTSS